MYCRLGARRSSARRTKTNMEVKIEKLIYGGEGLAHQDGATVFVPLVLPGEQVTVAPVERKKKFVRAKLVEVKEASAERVAALCPHFGICGGCDYQHIPYEAQLKYKAEILRETLRRLGRIDWTGEITAHGSPAWGYRNRAQWKVRPIAEPEQDSEIAATSPKTSSGGTKLAVGYFRANSTALCAVETCEIISPLLLRTLRALREAGLAGEFPRSLISGGTFFVFPGEPVPGR
jgi:23S rRNA (uracil1939-C5)-methyltransferase